jgi:hypothetical protein
MNIMFAVEMLASAFTLAGIYLGSTTFYGAWLYGASLIFWWWLTFGKKVWGIVPLNAATTVLVVFNLWKTWPV